MHQRTFVWPDTVVVPTHSSLWMGAVLAFFVGDLVTTTVGLSVGHVTEAGPVTAPLLAQYGLLAIVGLKALVLAVCYALWILVPRPHNVGVPLGLCLVGIVTSLWNAAIVAVAILG
ncbi:MAG: DUF5658 family protein [Halapricum sp.]